MRNYLLLAALVATPAHAGYRPPARSPTCQAWYNDLKAAAEANLDGFEARNLGFGVEIHVDHDGVRDAYLILVDVEILGPLKEAYPASVRIGDCKAEEDSELEYPLMLMTVPHV